MHKPNLKSGTAQRSKRFPIFKASALILLCGGMIGAAPVSAPEPISEVVRQIGIDQKLNAQLPLDAVFRDEQGREVRLGEYFKGKPVLLSFVYYECPMLCSLVLNGVVKALRVLSFIPGKEFEAVTISINPADTPALAAAKKESYLKAYAKGGSFPESGWHFLTGAEASIDAVTKAAGFRYMKDPRGKQFAHAGGIMVVTPEGRLAQYFYGIDYSPKDLRLALVEASKGKIGSLVDQLLLLCYHYDPIQGKYGLAIMSVIRILGLATLAALGGFIFISLRGEHSHTMGFKD